jgi:hypothetical protein
MIASGIRFLDLAHIFFGTSEPLAGSGTALAERGP